VSEYLEANGGAMIKRIIVLICIAAVVSGGIVFYWPQSFAKVIDENVGMYIQHIENVYDEQGKPKFDHNTTEFPLEPGSKQYAEIMEILSNYSYHRSLRTYFGDSTIHWGGNEAIQIFVYPELIINVGTKEISIGSKVYHLGYWGNKKAQSMLRDMKELLVK